MRARCANTLSSREGSRSYHTALSLIHHQPESKVTGAWELQSLIRAALYQTQRSASMARGRRAEQVVRRN